MKIIREYKGTHIDASVVIVGRDHEYTPFIVTIKAQGELAVEQDIFNGIYCMSLRAAESIVKMIR